MGEEKMSARGGRPRSISRAVAVRRRSAMCVRLTFRFLGTRWIDRVRDDDDDDARLTTTTMGMMDGSTRRFYSRSWAFRERARRRERCYRCEDFDLFVFLVLPRRRHEIDDDDAW
jgi:hypothetical protein